MENAVPPDFAPIIYTLYTKRMHSQKAITEQPSRTTQNSPAPLTDDFEDTRVGLAPNVRSLHTVLPLLLLLKALFYLDIITLKYKKVNKKINFSKMREESFKIHLTKRPLFVIITKSLVWLSR